MCVKERKRPLMSSGLGSFVHKKIENKIKGLYFNINILFKIIFILNYAYLFGTCDMRWMKKANDDLCRKIKWGSQ